MAEEATAYELARLRGRDELRTALLDTASHLLVTEGPAALTMRRIAAEVGCSTKVLYTQFGGKDGLANGLYQEGFERFRRRLEELPPDPDPLAHVYRIARVYRENALAEPNYYRVMFAEAIPGFVPDCDTDVVAGALGIMVDSVRGCIEAGVFADGDPAEIAEVLWAASHGVISLELAGHLKPDQAPSRYDTAVRAATSWFLRAPTQTP